MTWSLILEYKPDTTSPWWMVVCIHRCSIMQIWAKALVTEKMTICKNCNLMTDPDCKADLASELWMVVYIYRHTIHVHCKFESCRSEVSWKWTIQTILTSCPPMLLQEYNTSSPGKFVMVSQKVSLKWLHWLYLKNVDVVFCTAFEANSCNKEIQIDIHKP